MHTPPSVTQRLTDALAAAQPCDRLIFVSDAVLAAVAIETGMHVPQAPRPQPLDQLPAFPILDFAFGSLVGVGPASPEEPALIQHDQAIWFCSSNPCSSKIPLRRMKHTLVLPPSTLTPVQAEIYKCLREDGMPLQTAEKAAIRLAPATVTEGGGHEDLQPQ